QPDGVQIAVGEVVQLRLLEGGGQGDRHAVVLDAVALADSGDRGRVRRLGQLERVAAPCDRGRAPWGGARATDPGDHDGDAAGDDDESQGDERQSPGPTGPGSARRGTGGWCVFQGGHDSSWGSAVDAAWVRDLLEALRPRSPRSIVP